ncbi:hypothetical protein NQ318_023111 [Aromia moschata]|uniref:TRAF3-interacting protein 1 n=1 Tax=Aromia moschata TaxID=1265417 RepID=A0AAV8XG75_9CUCU|nr:hypothetical protein NQ318_023111 [Aromia moschata]
MSEDVNSDYVKKPPLTEKLLKKPPFRFLHDIINAIVNENGYLNGLFSEEELKIENVKEKDAKIAFLNKLIEAVKATTKMNLIVRSSKIVAGLEPTNTNLLLQAIGKALDAKIDSSDYIKQLNSGNTENAEKKKLMLRRARKTPSESPRIKSKASTPKDSSRSKLEKTSTKQENKIKIVEKQNSRQGKEVAVKEIAVESSKPKESTEVDASQVSSHKGIVGDDNDKEVVKSSAENVENTSEALKNTEPLIEKSVENQVENMHMENAQTEGDNRNSSAHGLKRPKSARPKSGERRGMGPKQNPGNIHQEEITEPLEMTMVVLKGPRANPRTVRGAPCVRRACAPPVRGRGPPRLRPDSALPPQEPIAMGNINVIIENVDGVADEEETVVIQTAVEAPDDAQSSVEVPHENKGQLVEQILEQIQGEEGGVKGRVDVDWEEGVLHSKDGATRKSTTSGV